MAFDTGQGQDLQRWAHVSKGESRIISNNPYTSSSLNPGRNVVSSLTSISCIICASSSSSSPRYPLLSDWFLPVFGTVDTGEGWKSQVCPRAIGGITTCHKMIHSLSLPTVTYICMGELPHFHHSPTTSFLHSQPIQAPPSGSGLVCAAGQMFIWDDPSVTPLSWSFTKGVPLLYPQCGTSILFWGAQCWHSTDGYKPPDFRNSSIR